MAAIVLVTRRLPEAVEERLRRDYAPRLNPDDRPYAPDELVERSAGASAILACATDAWPAAVIERLPDSVRAIATFSAGHEHIDLAAASERGITVSNTPDVLTEATADLTMLCLLGAARRASEGEALIRAGQWAGWTPTQLLGLELNGATLGIVGMGRIGQALARRARAFGMRISATAAVGACRLSSSRAPVFTPPWRRCCPKRGSSACTARRRSKPRA